MVLEKTIESIMDREKNKCKYCEGDRREDGIDECGETEDPAVLRPHSENDWTEPRENNHAGKDGGMQTTWETKIKMDRPNQDLHGKTSGMCKEDGDGQEVMEKDYL